jgi:hypothetical protein
MGDWTGTAARLLYSALQWTLLLCSFGHVNKSNMKLWLSVLNCWPFDTCLKRTIKHVEFAIIFWSHSVRTKTETINWRNSSITQNSIKNIFFFKFHNHKIIKISLRKSWTQIECGLFFTVFVVIISQGNLKKKKKLRTVLKFNFPFNCRLTKLMWPYWVTHPPDY